MVHLPSPVGSTSGVHQSSSRSIPTGDPKDVLCTIQTPDKFQLISLNRNCHQWQNAKVYIMVMYFGIYMYIYIYFISFEYEIIARTGLLRLCHKLLAFIEYLPFNSLRPRQNGRHFADDIFKCIFLNENVWIPIKISLKFVLKGSINDISALVQIMTWRRPGDKPLSEPMMVNLPTHMCVTRPQWVNICWILYILLQMYLIGNLHAAMELKV